MHFVFAFLLSALSLFLILLILVQRGRGGGLTGALGGMGGQSAFGTKAGDTFTKITVVSATVWILLAIVSIKLLGGKGGPLGDANAAAPPATSPAAGGAPDGATPDPLDSLPPSGGAGATPGSGGTPSDDAASSSPAESNPE